MNEGTKNRWFISDHRGDALFIILSPLLAFAILALVCSPRVHYGSFLYAPGTPDWFAPVVRILTYAHIMLVFLRSHLNANVFQRFRPRFVTVPLLLCLSMFLSPWLLGIMSFAAVYWDEWHSIMQTFGFGRIYDSRAGNDPHFGRKRDVGMCFVLGLLPHLVLLTMIPEAEVHAALVDFLDVPVDIAGDYHWLLPALKAPLITFGIGYTLIYALSYLRLRGANYRFPGAKLALYGVTAVSTLMTVTFFTVADGTAFGNIYHAIQYIFIVFFSERLGLAKLSRMPANAKGYGVIFMIMLMSALSLGAVRLWATDLPLVAAFWLMTSLMHFWFDGFIWSVRRHDVP